MNPIARTCGNILHLIFPQSEERMTLGRRFGNEDLVA